MLLMISPFPGTVGRLFAMALRRPMLRVTWMADYPRKGAGAMKPISDMSTISMRPDDGDAFRQALRLAQRRCDFPVAFGGPVQGEVLHLTQHIGVQTAGLRGLSVFAATGL